MRKKNPLSTVQTMYHITFYQCTHGYNEGIILSKMIILRITPEIILKTILCLISTTYTDVFPIQTKWHFLIDNEMGFLINTIYGHFSIFVISWINQTEMKTIHNIYICKRKLFTLKNNFSANHPLGPIKTAPYIVQSRKTLFVLYMYI